MDGADPTQLCEAFAARGYGLHSLKQYAEARTAFADCMDVDGGLSLQRGSARFHIGLGFYEEEDYAEAQQHFDMFLKMEGVFPEERKRATKYLSDLKKNLS